MMDRSTAGRLILITGASGGIGRAAVLQFAARGDRVLAVARSMDRLESLSADVDDPSRVIALQADLTDADATAAVMSRIIEDHGVPDVIVANAGIGLDALFIDTTDEALLAVFELNVFGLVRSVRPFVGGMLKRGSGRILFISSVVGKRGIPHYAGYSASKFALHGMAEALRAELFGSGVSVGVICPASTTTDFHDQLIHNGPPQNSKRLQRHSAESVAKAIVSMAGSRRREMILSIEGKVMNVINRLAPGLMDRILARMLASKK